MVNLKLGVGKAVIMKSSAQEVLSDESFVALVKQVEKLNGRYIIAEDGGTTPEIVEIIYQHARHVVRRSRTTSRDCQSIPCYLTV